jgi:lysophospholipase L1-like esterase
MKSKKQAGRIKYVFSITAIVIILLLILELGSFTAIKIYSRHRSEPNLGDIDNRVMAEHWKEAKMEWYPYVHNRRKPFDGTYTHVMEGGVRVTKNPCAQESSLKIFMFGGSTMWGNGVRDEDTIPSLLSEYLCYKGVNVYVTNFGEDGYVSTQEVFTLVLELQKGNTPDIVIFVDGINDVWSAYQNSVAGVPENIFKRRFEFGSYERYNLRSSNLMKIILYLASPPYLYNGKPDMGADIIRIYETNIRLIKALEGEYGFTSFLFWQPSLFSKKEISKKEKEILDNEPKELKSMFATTNPLLTSVMNESDNIFDISDIFNDNPETVYYYDSMHLLRDGNKVLAEEIGDKIIRFIDNSIGAKLR